ncbi:golgin subfamily A member 6-like protein 6 isoform X3 [Simochromis diagramma]|uniref:golgin subfamily A member 6-like protein 6 isoform X3 n=1 Tax=Simochromis diagramma TaxID=43689 RepID=UPI001A7E9852|nr:golgin subfamily A member 6-like protein 6 isoform X3 [Simochromis diagramma]
MRAACAQPRKSSTLSETLSHASHLSSCSGEKELIVANQSPETELNIIKELLNEFRGLHELKLRCLEEDTSRRGELPQKKVDFLQSYVNDLTDHIQVLVQTIEDLQRGAGQNHDRVLAVSEAGLKPLLLDEVTGPVAHIPRSSDSVDQMTSETEDVKIQLQTKDMIISDLERELAENIQGKQKTATQVLESGERLVHLQSELSCLRRIHEDNMKEIAEKDICITKLQANIQLLQQEGADTLAQLEASRKQVERQRRELSELHQKEETLLCETKAKMVHLKDKLRDRFKRMAEEKETRIKQLTDELNGTRQKMQKREVKICTLMKELTESKGQHSECQKELLRKDRSLEKLREERDELRVLMEDRSKECAHLDRSKAKLEADLALSHKLHTSHLEVRSRDELILQLRAEMKTAEQKHRGTQKQVTALEEEVRHLNCTIRAHKEEACQLSEKVSDIEHLREQKEKEQQQLQEQLRIKEQQADTVEKKLNKEKEEVELLNQQLKESKDELKEANLHTQEQKETAAIFKQKYTAAIEKARRVQEHVERLEEELQYSQEKLRESQLAASSLKEELAELERRYQEKVGQWENSQEALDQLTDELQASHNLLRESEQKLEHFKNLMRSLQEQMDTLNQQKLAVECDLQLYRRSHSHSDEEYLSLGRLRQQLQKRCAAQVEHLAVCENTILQMKSELERQVQEKVGLKPSLAASQQTHRSNQKQLEQEVIRSKQEVASLELELANAQKVQVTLLRQSDEELKEARQESARKSREVDAERRKAQMLQEALHKEQQKLQSAIRENETLSTLIGKLRKELEELHSSHQVTVEELAARAEEVRRMEGCLNEGKLAEEKIRSMAAGLKKELTEAVHQKLTAEREKQDALDQVITLRSELEGTRSDNAKLLHESQLVMTNVNLWITEQKASSESIIAQIKAQNKALLVITKEKECLQEANDTLKAEVKRLKEAVDEKEKDMELFKAHLRDWGVQQDRKTMEKKGCVALNLSKIEDMQTRLQSNLEAIGMLNQQLGNLSQENKRLRRQLEEERSMHRQVERSGPLPPPPTTTIHLPLSLSVSPPICASLPSSLGLPRLLSIVPVTGDTNGTQTKPTTVRVERPGESKASDKASLIRPSSKCAFSASVEDAGSKGTSRNPAK